jgi:hypothetical protein
MSVDELRDIIWAYLYQANEARTLDEIAAFVDRDRDAIRNAIEHEWFSVAGDEVSIAYKLSAARNLT